MRCADLELSSVDPQTKRDHGGLPLAFSPRSHLEKQRTPCPSRCRALGDLACQLCPRPLRLPRPRMLRRGIRELRLPVPSVG